MKKQKVFARRSVAALAVLYILSIPLTFAVRHVRLKSDAERLYDLESKNGFQHDTTPDFLRRQGVTQISE